MILKFSIALPLCTYILSRAIGFSNAVAPTTEGSAVVIDAGSTGTRMYVYRYTYGPVKAGDLRRQLKVDLPALLTKRISPGVAAFAEQVLADGDAAQETNTEDEEQAKVEQTESALSGEQFHSDVTPAKTFAGYMRRLRRVAKQALRDPSEQDRALLVLRGTAGMRALPKKQQTALLKAICASLERWGLRYLPGKSCGILSGHEEGVLGWLALNQLLGRLPEELSMVRLSQQPEREEGVTAAMIEMGGASAQVVFELAPSVLGDTDITAARQRHGETEDLFLVPVEGHADLMVLRIGGKKILLLTKSYLGLGMHQYSFFLLVDISFTGLLPNEDVVAY